MESDASEIAFDEKIDQGAKALGQGLKALGRGFGKLFK
jgi:hypothetical protein